MGQGVHFHQACRDLCSYFKLKSLSHLYYRLHTIIMDIFLSAKPVLSIPTLLPQAPQI